MKVYALLIAAITCHLTASAQKFNSYYLKDNGKQVSTKDSADFLRIVYEADTTTGLYPVKEYYINGKPKSLGTSTSINPPMYHNVYRSFHPNGSKQYVCTYVNGQKTGEAYSYYSNGKLCSVITYSPQEGFNQAPLPRIHTVNDSTGTSMVVNGNGHLFEFEDNNKTVMAEGEVKDGLREGLWTGRDGNNMTFKETYAKGKLISGESTGKDGIVKTYKVDKSLPAFRGGIQNFYTYLQRTVKYPENARKLGIQGKVVVHFTVEKDGTLSDVRAVKRLNSELEAEAVRVISQSPRWIPATMRGQNVRVQFTVPVSFAM